MSESSAGPLRTHALLPREPWRRNQVAVTVAAAMVFLGFTLVTPFLPFYIQTLGIHQMRSVALWSGVLLTITPLLASILGPWWGRLADRVGMKIMVQRILFAIAAHWGLMYFVTNVWQMLGLLVLLGTMSVALVTHGCPRERIGRAVGVLQATQILSTAIGPLFGGLLAHAIGIRSAFLVTCALCSTAFFFVLALYRDTGPETEPAGSGMVVVPQEGPVTAGVRAVVSGTPAAAAGASRVTPSFRDILRRPLFIHLLPQLFLINMVDRSLFLVVPLFVSGLAAGRDGAEALTGIVVSAGALASAASAYAIGRKASRASPMPLLRLSLAGSTVAIAPMAFCRSLTAFTLLRVILGLAVGGAMTLVYTLGGHLIPPNARATAYSILSSAAMLGGALGPVLCGLLTSIDVRATLLLGACVYLALTLHAASLSRRAGVAAAFGGPAVREKRA